MVGYPFLYPFQYQEAPDTMAAMRTTFERTKCHIRFNLSLPRTSSLVTKWVFVQFGKLHKGQFRSMIIRYITQFVRLFNRREGVNITCPYTSWPFYPCQMFLGLACRVDCTAAETLRPEVQIPIRKSNKLPYCYFLRDRAWYCGFRDFDVINLLGLNLCLPSQWQA